MHGRSEAAGSSRVKSRTVSLHPETLLDGANWIMAVVAAITVSIVGYALRRILRRVRVPLRLGERELQPGPSGRDAIAETLTNVAHSSQSALEAISDGSRVDDGALTRLAITPSFAAA